MMTSWLLKRRLTRNAARLASLRSELRELDEQIEQFRSDADDSAIRALVSDAPAAAREADDDRKHADAMGRHRSHVVDTIRELEARQDALLDRLTGS